MNAIVYIDHMKIADVPAENDTLNQAELNEIQINENN
jgi:hypothetical protein